MRKLFIEYAEWIGVDLSSQGFDEELASLPGIYHEPHGALFLSMRGKESAGCVAVRPLGDGVCEMKRLWVRPRFRGQTLGLRLASAAIDAAHRLGYKSMRLDTLDWMHDALHLCRSLGFHEVPPRDSNPLPGIPSASRSLSCSNPTPVRFRVPPSAMLRYTSRSKHPPFAEGGEVKIGS